MFLTLAILDLKTKKIEKEQLLKKAEVGQERFQGGVLPPKKLHSPAVSGWMHNCFAFG